MDVVIFVSSSFSDNDIGLDYDIPLRVHAARLLNGPSSTSDAPVYVVDCDPEAIRTL